MELISQSMQVLSEVGCYYLNDNGIMLGKLSISLFGICDLKYSIVEPLVSNWSIDTILNTFLSLHWVLTLWPKNQPINLRAIPWLIGKVPEYGWSITDPH